MVEKQDRSKEGEEQKAQPEQASTQEQVEACPRYHHFSFRDERIGRSREEALQRLKQYMNGEDMPPPELRPNLLIREARAEDHDDLVPVFNSQSEVLTERFGEFFIAELIEIQDSSNR